MMGDYISREAVERFIENGLNNPDKSKAFGHDAVEILTEVHFMDAADVRPVVLCRDCKYRGCSWTEYDESCHNPRFGDGWGEGGAGEDGQSLRPRSGHLPLHKGGIDRCGGSAGG